MHRARFTLAVLAVLLVSLGVSARVASRPAATVSPDASSQNTLPSKTPSTSTIGLEEPPGGVAFRLPWPWPGMKPLPPTASWQPVPVRKIDRFALSEDRNVLDHAFAPRRLEAGAGAVVGPALAVAGLNAVNTLGLGLHDRGAPARQTIELHNVGNEPLTISRIYSACGCLTETRDDGAIDPAGWLEPALVLAPGAASEGAYSHDGEEFLHVLSGCIEIVLDEEEFHVLGPGDSLYFGSRRKHAWSNAHDDVTVLLWINTPRSF